MEPSYFGTSDCPLLGLYDPPAGSRDRKLGVLLCYPGPQEYLASHWAFRKLAALLSREGIHVFRFDYAGTGDSGGASDLGSLARWRGDVEAALQELKDVSGVRRVSVVGCRLGAALAAEAGLRVRDLVLWEPVVLGKAHVAEMVQAHHRRFAHCLHPPELPRSGPLGELLGLAFPPGLQEEVEAIDLCAAPLACRAQRIVLVSSERRPELDALAHRIQSTEGPDAPRFEWHRVEEDHAAADDDAFLLSTRAQRQIATTLAETGSA